MIQLALAAKCFLLFALVSASDQEQRRQELIDTLDKLRPHTTNAMGETQCLEAELIAIRDLTSNCTAQFLRKRQLISGVTSILQHWMWCEANAKRLLETAAYIRVRPIVHADSWGVIDDEGTCGNSIMSTSGPEMDRTKCEEEVQKLQTRQQAAQAHFKILERRVVDATNEFKTLTTGIPESLDAIRF